jgi:hypothetical protein
MTDNETVLAWHFVGDTLRDGRPVPADGEWLEHDGALVMCESGLHASIRLIDALRYAPGATICRVVCAGEMEHDYDKLVAMRRRIAWRIDGEAVLRAFSRWCALQVASLWDMPDVVREYLETGDESLRAAAGAAARDAAGAAAGAAARDAQNEQLERMVKEARNGRTEWAWQAALADSGPGGEEEG